MQNKLYLVINFIRTIRHSIYILYVIPILFQFCLFNIRGDGEYYIGEYNNGLRHGYGEHYFSNGNIYKGNWVNNYMKGQGTMTYNDGTVESGLWEEASG